jgi:hypothetical protein
VELGICGSIRGGEPTWLLKTHSKVLAVVVSTIMAFFQEIMWFDVLHVGIYFALSVPVNITRDIKTTTFLI